MLIKKRKKDVCGSDGGIVQLGELYDSDDNEVYDSDSSTSKSEDESTDVLSNKDLSLSSSSDTEPEKND